MAARATMIAFSPRPRHVEKENPKIKSKSELAGELSEMLQNGCVLVMPANMPKKGCHAVLCHLHRSCGGERSKSLPPQDDPPPRGHACTQCSVCTSLLSVPSLCPPCSSFPLRSIHPVIHCLLSISETPISSQLLTDETAQTLFQGLIRNKQNVHPS